MTRYEKAPITEALIDIQFAGPETSLAELAGLQEREGDSYPDRRPLYIAAFQVDGTQSGVPPGVSQASSQRGWAFVTADKLRVWQLRNGGFTFSRLAPYESWEPFRAEARRLWELVRGGLRVETVSRVAVRYINRLELPLPLRDFKDYLRTVPEVSPALPQGLLTYFMQLQIPQEDLQALLILNQQLVPPNVQEPPKAVTVVLDIDLYRAQDLPQDEEGLWHYFERLHTRKNETFEGCITDLTRELIR